MNCQTARQTLELLRPDENATAISGEAEQHVRDCMDCQDAVRTQRQFDLRMGRMCRDVDVPVGLKERLLAEAAAASASDDRRNSGESGYGPETAPQPMATEPAVSTRRRWLVRSAVAAAVVAAATVAIVFSRPAAPTFTLEDLMKQSLDASPEGMSEIQAFSKGVSLKLPTTMDTRFLIGATPQQLGTRDVAVYFFTIRDRTGSFPGRLIVVPAASLSDAPTATSFLGGGPQYKPPYVTTSWVEGNLAYVCCVKGGEAMLVRLKPLAV